jgi:hypothetical protein
MAIFVAAIGFWAKHTRSREPATINSPAFAGIFTCAGHGIFTCAGQWS